MLSSTWEPSTKILAILTKPLPPFLILKLRHDNPNAMQTWTNQDSSRTNKRRQKRFIYFTRAKQSRIRIILYFKYNTRDTRRSKGLIKLIKSVKMPALTPQRRALMEFAQCNCLHKTKNYELASKHLQLANKSKLIAFSSNAKTLQKSIAASTSKFEAKDKTYQYYNRQGANFYCWHAKKRVDVTGNNIKHES